MNLKVLKRSRHKPKAGDIFVNIIRGGEKIK